MTNKEKAMYIAEKQGWCDDDDTELWYTDGWKADSKVEWLHQYYSSFNGLMPIVVEINMNTTYCIKIEVSKVVLSNLGYRKELLIYDNELELIDALQNAIIKYYESVK